MRLEAVWLRNDGEWRGQMRCGPFSSCVRCRRGGLEGAGRGKQKEHTVRASAIHAKNVIKSERCRVNWQNQGQRDAMRCGAGDGDGERMSMPAKGAEELLLTARLNCDKQRVVRLLRNCCSTWCFSGWLAASQGLALVPVPGAGACGLAQRGGGPAFSEGLVN